MLPELSEFDAHWVWLSLGLLLAVLEVIAPGVFLIWLAGAALLTGLVTWLLPISAAMQVVLFAILSAVAVLAGRRYLRNNPIVDADPKMNHRGARLAGETAVVVTPFDGGTGRVRHGDSEWLARMGGSGDGDGELLPETRVRITGSDGAVLLVERLG